MAARSAREGSATVGRIIREYRLARGITQKQFAGALGVEARTLRMYENGERELENISDLRRIADLLAIDPVELGLAARTPATSPQQLYATVEHVAALLLQTRLSEARTTLEGLLHDLRRPGERDDPAFLRALASVHCMAGHVQSLTSKTSECTQMIQQYQETARLAHKLDDQTLLALGLAYHGEILRRRGEVAQAFAMLEKARSECAQASPAARGTIALLLGRVHLARREYSSFQRELECAAEMAREVEQHAEGALTSLSPGVVYAEYARGYALPGQLELCQRYLDQAEEHLPACNFWSLQLKATRAEALVHANDVATALPLLIEVAHQAQMCGYQLLIERLYRLQYFLEDQISLLRQASRSLGGALYGPIEH